jgi:hypothetical protein
VQCGVKAGVRLGVARLLLDVLQERVQAARQGGGPLRRLLLLLLLLLLWGVWLPRPYFLSLLLLLLFCDMDRGLPH